MKKYCRCFKGESLIPQIFPETKIEFPVSFQLKNVNINTSIRTNLKALYKENVVY